MGLLDPRQQRGRNDSRPRNTLETKPQRYYRPEYGWAMTGDEMERERKVEQIYADRSQRVAAAIEKERKQFDDTVNKSRREFNAAWSQGHAPTMPLRVIDYTKSTGERRIVKQYTLPTEYVKQLHYENFGTGKKGTPWGAFSPDGSYNVETYVHGGGDRKYEKDIVSALDKVQAQYDATMRARAREQAAQAAQMEGLIAKERQAANKYWNNTQARVDNAYGERKQQAADRFQQRRQDNTNSVLGMDEGLLSSRIGVQL